MNFGETYLYKLHKLTNTLDKAFDQTLKNHTEIGLSQFSLLLAIHQEGNVNQRQVASFLEVSTPAISRQVDIARRMGWVNIGPSLTDTHGNSLSLTSAGTALVAKGLSALEQHLFKIFADHNHHTNLMEHIDTLLANTKGVYTTQLKIKHDHQVNHITKRTLT